MYEKLKFRVTCDRVNCKWNLGRVAVFRHQCKKKEIRLAGGECLDFEEREMKYAEEVKVKEVKVKGLDEWI